MAKRELAWLFHEPYTGLDHCLIILHACFRKRMSVAVYERVRECESEGCLAWRVIIIFAEFIRRDARNFSPMSNAKLLGNARGKGTLSPFPWSSAGPNV